MRVPSIAFAAVVAAVLSGVASLGDASAARSSLETDLQAVKAATARYHSIEQAEKAGYIVEPFCVSSPLGGMGHHAVNPALMADDGIDLLQPEIRVYAPKENGKLELVAVEYWKRDADQSLLTSGDRPSLFGQPFDGPMPGHNPAMPVHYDLHVWLYKENPRGMFVSFNPDVVCPAG